MSPSSQNNFNELHARINQARDGYEKFIDQCMVPDNAFRLTPNAEPTAFARCFGLFGLHLLGSDKLKNYCNEDTAYTIRDDLEQFKQTRLQSGINLAFDKPYLQLLCFSLSALHIVNGLRVTSLEDHVIPLVNRDIRDDLVRSGCFDGRPASGNQAMFIAILTIYANQWLNHSDAAGRLEYWVNEHLMRQNQFGFWGASNSMTHLQFQNGYHQYEIFEYLDIENLRLAHAADFVASLADFQGHFGPYPGGGSCYDYDALAIILSSPGGETKYKNLLTLTVNTILSEQNQEGGFCDTLYLRPRNRRNLRMMLSHIFSGSNFTVKKERAQLGLILMLSRHDRIRGHWSTYSRKWGESSLWDSWFRMLTIARIQMCLDPDHDGGWGFINFPGIGFVKNKARSVTEIHTKSNN